ncbi:MAG: substrate-binding domain-containing protein [Deltaproteobacteria bacterium]|nr:substrate-binding domain-containing protein [Deltaproteobacteria bacterium]
MKMVCKKMCVVACVLVCLIGLSGNAAVAGGDVLKMATTTSTDNTGLLDYLAPVFKADSGIELQWVSVGTGKALALGKNCDVDVLLVHAPAAEMKLVQDGSVIDRTELMFNDFVFIGPPSDPAGVKGASVKDALGVIASKKASFASRGDNSGTNKKELQLWKHAQLAVPDKETWYIQTGQGMLNTINIAAERDAYTMTDRGTYIKYESNWKGNPPLVILVEGDSTLRNQYSALAVNPKKCSNVKYDLAKKFIVWMASDKTQKLIGNFELMKKQLFIPNAK